MKVTLTLDTDDGVMIKGSFHDVATKRFLQTCQTRLVQPDKSMVDFAERAIVLTGQSAGYEIVSTMHTLAYETRIRTIR